MKYQPTIFTVTAFSTLLLLAACGRTTTPDAPQVASGRTTSSRPTSAPARPVVVAPPTGYAWDGQASVAAYKASFDQTVNTSVTVLRTLGFSLDQKQSRRSLDAATIIGTNNLQRPARVEIRPISQTRVEVRATIGAAGDRSSSERLLGELSKSLGEAQ